jgi:hypothetical protein
MKVVDGVTPTALLWCVWNSRVGDEGEEGWHDVVDG